MDIFCSIFFLHLSTENSELFEYKQGSPHRLKVHIIILISMTECISGIDISESFLFYLCHSEISELFECMTEFMTDEQIESQCCNIVFLDESDISEHITGDTDIILLSIIVDIDVFLSLYLSIDLIIIEHNRWARYFFIKIFRKSIIEKSANIPMIIPHNIIKICPIYLLRKYNWLRCWSIDSRHIFCI